MIFLENTNAVRITAEELSFIAGAEGEYLLSEKNRNKITQRLANRFSNDPLKAGAILIRLITLMKLLDKENLLVWVHPERLTNRGFFYNAIFAAAATLPLIRLANDEITFEREVFFQGIYAHLYDAQTSFSQS